MFELLFSKEATLDFKKLQNDSSLSKRFKAVQKALGYLQINSKHPSLNTHKYKSAATIKGEDIFEAYAENNTPGAYRIFWHYGPGKATITIISIIKHP